MAVPVLLAAVHAAPAPWAAAPPTPGPQASRHRPEADRLEVLALLALVRLEAVLRSALDLLAAELRRQALLLVLPAQVRLVTAPLGLALLAAIHGSEAGKTKTRGELRKVNHMRRGEKSSNIGSNILVQHHAPAPPREALLAPLVRPARPLAPRPPLVPTTSPGPGVSGM